MNIDHLSDDQLLIKKNVTLIPPELLSEREIKKDIGYLIYAFKNAYGGYNYLPDGESQNAIEALNQLYKNVKSITPKELCSAVDDIFYQISDNHLKARMQGEKSCSKKRHAYIPSIGANVTSSKKTWEFKIVKTATQEIPVFSIKSFPNYQDISWNGFEDTFQVIRKHQNLIIDLRGNTGGDDRKGFALVDFLYGDMAPNGTEQKIVRAGRATKALLVNIELLEILYLQQQNKNVPQYLTENYEEAFQRYKSVSDNTNELIENNYRSQTNLFNKERGYCGKIYVLIDDGCGSRCEGVLLGLKSHPGTIVAGKNSSGTKHFGNMGILLLPHSKIIIQMGTHFWKLKNSLYIEKRGIAPDIIIQEGKDAFNVILQTIEKAKMYEKKQ